ARAAVGDPVEGLHDLQQADGGAGGELAALGDERWLVGGGPAVEPAAGRGVEHQAQGGGGADRGGAGGAGGPGGAGGELQRRIELDQDVAIADRVDGGRQPQRDAGGGGVAARHDQRAGAAEHD